MAAPDRYPAPPGTVAETLRAQAATLRAQADTLEALASALPAAAPDLLDARQALEAYGVGRDGLLAAEGRGEIALTRGARNRILVARADLEAYLRRPHAPTKPRGAKRRSNITELAAWQAEADAELRALGGSR